MRLDHSVEPATSGRRPPTAAHLKHWLSQTPHLEHLRRRQFCLALAPTLPLLWSSTAAQAPAFDAPNIVPISARLVTSGQPSAAALAQLGRLGFGAVAYLAPPTVPDAVRNEAAILELQGIDFANPTEAHFASFVEVLSRFSDRKVLVHCQVNMRASTMVFLYRVIVGKEPPEQAYGAVAMVWSPQGPWKALLATLLRKHQVSFDPY